MNTMSKLCSFFLLTAFVSLSVSASPILYPDVGLTDSHMWKVHRRLNGQDDERSQEQREHDWLAKSGDPLFRSDLDYALGVGVGPHVNEKLRRRLSTPVTDGSDVKHTHADDPEVRTLLHEESRRLQSKDHINRRLRRRKARDTSEVDVRRDVEEGFVPFVSIDKRTGEERLGEYGRTLFGDVPNFDYDSYLLNRAMN